MRSIFAASSARDGTATIDARQVAQHREAVVVVEVSAEALLVAEAGDAHDHRVRELAAREERERRRLAAELILGVVQVREELDLGDGQEPDLAGADGHAEDRLLVEQRVEDASRAERLPEPHRHAVHAALLGDVLPEHEHLGVLPHQIGERGADPVRERPAACRRPSGGGAYPLRRASAVTRSAMLGRDRRHHLGARRELRSR